jgi:internalin A
MDHLVFPAIARCDSLTTPLGEAPMTLRAFVSSTFQDLRRHRARVIEALERGGIVVDPMERWPADADEPCVFSQRRVAGCQLCVLLVARRRGHVPDPATDPRSITQMEYDEARRLGIDVLVFLLDEADKDWPGEHDERGTDPGFAAWLAALKKGHGVGIFAADPTSLDRPVFEAVSRWKERRREREHRETWFREVLARFSLIHILKIPQPREISNPPLRRLYVEQAVAASWIRPEDPPAEWPARLPADEAFRRHPRLVLLGDPGGGKSTLVAWIAWQLAAAGLGQLRLEESWPASLGREGPGPLLPFPLILRELGLEKLGDTFGWDRLWQAFLDRAGAPLRNLDWQQYLDAGQGFFLLDGLDEIGSPRTRRALRDAVFEGMARYPRCRWLLTSRVVGYEAVPFHQDEDARPDELLVSGEERPALGYLSPFDDEQIERFASNWYGWRLESTAQAKEAAGDLVAALRRDPGMSSLGRTPYLLTLMALIHRAGATLPHGWALVYNQIADLFLQGLDDAKKVQARAEGLETKRQWVAHVGFAMQSRRARKGGREDGLFATQEEVSRWLAEAMDPAQPGTRLSDAAEFTAYLAERTGLLLPRGQNQFGFLHLTFLEYFAACFLEHALGSRAWIRGDWSKVAEGARRDDLRRYANDPLWQQTLVFLAELLANGKHPEYLDDLLAALFDDDFAAVDPQDRDQEARARLLARLAVDPQAGFSAEQRARALEVCCRFEAVAQTREEALLLRSSNVLRELFNAEPAHLPAVMRTLTESVQAAGLTALSLNGVGIRNLEALAPLRGLKGLFLHFTLVADLAPLSRFGALEWLTVGATSVRDLAPLAGLGRLRALHLDRSPVTDLGPLVSLTNLQSLHLSGTPVTDLAPLSRLAGLTSLYLEHAPVADLSPLSRLTALRTLSLGHTAVSNLSPLSGLAGLRRLHLNSTQVTDLAPLAGLAGLECLSVKTTAVADIRPLAELTGLQTLSLARTRVADLTPLASLYGLESLYLDSSQVTDLRPLAGLRSLASLTLNDTRVSDLQPLIGLTSLRTLYLTGTAVSDQAIEGLRLALPNCRIVRSHRAAGPADTRS